MKYRVTVPGYAGKVTTLQFPDTESFNAYLKERAAVAEMFGVTQEFTVETWEENNGSQRTTQGQSFVGSVVPRD